MRVFLTGASGFVGSAVAQELVGAGHQVLGLSRSDAGAKFLESVGAEVHRGTLEDLASLRSGAAKSDAVIHCAFDFGNFSESAEADKKAIEIFGEVFAGSDRPILVSTGIPLDSPDHPATEDTVPPEDQPTPRVSEQATIALSRQGIRASVIRLSQVHNTVKQGLVTHLISIASQKRVSAYVGEGLNRWSAAHLLDVARLYRLALEQPRIGARFNAVAEQGVSLREIAEAIGLRLNVPVVSIAQSEAAAHFGFFGKLIIRDLSASSVKTQQWLGWQPTGRGLIEDITEFELGKI